MDSNWSKVYETQYLHKAEILKGVLDDHNIEVIILNKQNSSYLSLNTGNDVQVYVKNLEVLEAKHLITKHDL